MAISAARIDGLKVAKARMALPMENGRHVSQQKLADRAGMHVVTISNIERGAVSNTTLDTIGRLAQHLHVALTDLLADDSGESSGDDDEEADPVADLFKALDRYVDHKMAGQPKERQES